VSIVVLITLLNRSNRAEKRSRPSSAFDCDLSVGEQAGDESLGLVKNQRALDSLRPLAVPSVEQLVELDAAVSLGWFRTEPARLIIIGSRAPDIIKPLDHNIGSFNVRP
jgi:hypothetical protein